MSICTNDGGKCEKGLGKITKHHNADDNRKQKTDKRVRIRLEKLWTNQRSATREPVVAVIERILYEARVPGDGTMLI